MLDNINLVVIEARRKTEDWFLRDYGSKKGKFICELITQNTKVIIITIGNFLTTFTFKIGFFFRNLRLELKSELLIKKKTCFVKKSPRILVSWTNDCIMCYKWNWGTNRFRSSVPSFWIFMYLKICCFYVREYFRHRNFRGFIADSRVFMFVAFSFQNELFAKRP